MPTPTAPRIELDLVVNNGSGPCSVVDATATVNAGSQIQVAVCAANLPTDPDHRLAEFGYRITYDDSLIRAPEVPDSGAAIDDNPDANAGATTFGATSLGPNWQCQASGGQYPRGDLNPENGPGNGEVYSGACRSHLPPHTLGAEGVLSVVTFDAFVPGTTVLDLNKVLLFGAETDVVLTIGQCEPEFGGPPLICTDGTLTVVGAPQPTFTPIPSTSPAPVATATPSGVPQGIYLDFNIANGSGPCDVIDASSTVAVGSFVEVAVCQINFVSEPNAAFQYGLIYNDTIIAAPEVADIGPGLDDNPDANAGTTTFGPTNLGPFWDCTGGVAAYPRGDSLAATGAGNGRAFSGACTSLAGPYTLGPSGVLSIVTFVGVTLGTSTISITAGAITPNSLSATISCDPVVDTPMACVGGAINVVAPSPTPTPTLGITVNKTPISSNLFLCELGPCSGVGEGDVVISEVVAGITEPLGAWEIQIKFDHKIFNVEIDPNEALFTDFGRTPNCNIQVVTENWILFGCVSTGPVGSGFTGGPAALATVTLTPNEDLKFRLHPGNDNGVVRMILDENCEVANTLGHPQPGSVNGGLAAECGDASVTARILEGDLNLDCSVDLLDEQLIASKYGTFFGNVFYDPWFDLEPALKDFDIDIKDMQKVFGRDGSTCQNPIPAQPPAQGLSVGPL
jgi:hypothetical protein